MNLPKVSIIVTTYVEKNKPYLDLCMKSIEGLNYNKDLLDIVLVSHKHFLPEYPNVRTISPLEEEFGNPRGLNYGIEQAAPDSQYFFILNDDVMLTEDSLLHLIYQAGPDRILNPMEMVPQALPFTKKPPVLQTRTFGVMFMPYLCMFATLIPRLVYEKIGGFDENFKTGQDDIDYSWRAQQAGVGTALCLSSLVWHFGGVSSNETIKNHMRAANVHYFEKKWGKLPPFVTRESLNALEQNQAVWT